ncbi:protein of unknown function [Candidatus Nitrosocosmicus franklandus]|uniref:Uncharacterized protein n=1 Tax=Candidatus Nitrosocosmicus franklandianus TaxID=1798806 RepID=A0A484ICD7_9ARCH|nr:protein of unknown function [Candidatus Nitrosocosmicus franklandus]
MKNLETSEITIANNKPMLQIKVEEAVIRLVPKNSDYGLHCLVIYDNLATFRKFYSCHIKRQLAEEENAKSIIIINPFYET